MRFLYKLAKKMSNNTFKRNRQPINEISIEYFKGIISRKGAKTGNSSRKVSNPPQGNTSNCYSTKPTKKGVNSKPKNNAYKEPKQKKETKESPYNFDDYELIFNS